MAVHPLHVIQKANYLMRFNLNISIQNRGGSFSGDVIYIYGAEKHQLTQVSVTTISLQLYAEV